MPDWLDFDQLAEWVSGAWWSYLVIFAIAVIDAFFPLVPSETLVVIGGSLAASGDLSFPLVVLAGAAGAVLGDNISYWIGHFVGEKTVRRLLRRRSGTAGSTGRSAHSTSAARTSSSSRDSSPAGAPRSRSRPGTCRRSRGGGSSSTT